MTDAELVEAIVRLAKAYLFEGVGSEELAANLCILLKDAGRL